MTDRLFLSIWLERQSRLAPQGPKKRLRYLEQVLRLFPLSQRGQPQTIVTIRALDVTEPPLLERPFNAPIDLEQVIETLQDYTGADVAYEVETYWDLWQFDQDWALAPSRVLLSCFGPEFDNGTERGSSEQEDLQVDFGVDSHYLPRLDVPGGAKLIESNVRSVLRLVHDIENALPVEKRLLETESGGNFAERLQQELEPGASRRTM
ncbi:MAG TPA: hypothetical protein VHZ07_18410 [Bryobacteraceae bacterium]|nr:hypothetical protein [Bryobacteraceae bacterium]